MGGSGTLNPSGLGLNGSGEVIAQVLGISVDELAAAREEGKNIRQLAAELGLDGPTIRENMKAVREATILQAAADGVITEEQAELLLNAPAPRLRPRPSR